MPLALLTTFILLNFALSPYAYAILETGRSFRALGLSYFVFFDGPGLSPENHSLPPNVLGLPEDDGLRLTNYGSIRYRYSQDWAVDFQIRVQCILNNARNANDFQALRWQSPRIGLSSTLLSGESWQLTGAVNSDFPYFFPEPLGGGFIAKRRTTLFNPGLFAKFNYHESKSRWSLSSLVMPRLFFYHDRAAAEPQLERGGYSPGLKPELSLSFSPSVNYSLSPLLGLRVGTELTYKKLVLSKWNPFDGSLNGTDTHGTAWRLAPVPLQLGITYEPTPQMNLSVFIQAFPLASQRVRNNGEHASLSETASVGMWMSGTLL